MLAGDGCTPMRNADGTGNEQEIQILHSCMLLKAKIGSTEPLFHARYEDVGVMQDDPHVLLKGLLVKRFGPDILHAGRGWTHHS